MSKPFTPCVVVCTTLRGWTDTVLSHYPSRDSSDRSSDSPMAHKARQHRAMVTNPGCTDLDALIGVNHSDRDHPAYTKHLTRCQITIGAPRRTPPNKRDTSAAIASGRTRNNILTNNLYVLGSST